jgi:hypothetical protein
MEILKKSSVGALLFALLACDQPHVLLTVVSEDAVNICRNVAGGKIPSAPGQPDEWNSGFCQRLAAYVILGEMGKCITEGTEKFGPIVAPNFCRQLHATAKNLRINVK